MPSSASRSASVAGQPVTVGFTWAAGSSSTVQLLAETSVSPWNSVTFPVTSTWSPTASSAAAAREWTKTPSDAPGVASSAGSPPVPAVCTERPSKPPVG